MAESEPNFAAGLEAVAAAGGAAAMGVIALALELVQAGILPAEAAQRVRDLMVDQVDDNPAARRIKREIATAIARSFDWGGAAQE